MKELDYIRKTLPPEELLTLLAEEAAELAKAALKLRRALDGTNPTPVTAASAYDSLLEEIADVWLTMRALGLDKEAETCEATMTAKLERWAKRMKAKERSHGSDT